MDIKFMVWCGFMFFCLFIVFVCIVTGKEKKENSTLLRTLLILAIILCIICGSTLVEVYKKESAKEIEEALSKGKLYYNGVEISKDSMSAEQIMKDYSFNIEDNDIFVYQK